MSAWLLFNAPDVERDDIILEDESMTTNENGAKSCAIIDRLFGEHGRREDDDGEGEGDDGEGDDGEEEVVLVSKSSHLDWAMELYAQYPRLRGARMSGADVDRGALMRQLKEHADRGDTFALTRWNYLDQNVTGLD
uniref:Uncharacterized protein n=1 Tax=Odontella aurita TaxID=265563 RepID=A0A7S4HN98_9STRA|mmetsp:Transcript_12645/g.37272  ORF Transcript_12645/g.37272 Transcript_12645/m.37272 type:complete len:136 (+) Transcript_12645:213-620(+)